MRERERDTQSPWEREVLGEQLVLFKSSVTHLSQNWQNIQLSSFVHMSEFNAGVQECEERLGRHVGDVTGVSLTM